MNKIKKALSLSLILVVLSGCSAKSVYNNIIDSSINNSKITSGNQKEVDDEFKLNKKNMIANNRTSIISNKNETLLQANSKTAVSNSSSLPKSDNTPKKIIAQAPKNNIPPTKPVVINTVKKVEVPIPGAENNNKTAINLLQSSGEKLPITSSQSSSANIPGLPQFNYEVNNYQDYSKAIFNSLKNFESNIYIKLDNYNDSLYNLNVIDSIMTNDYDVDYGLKSVGAQLYTMGDINILNVQFSYSYSKDQLIAMRDSSQAKATQIIGQIIKTGMSDLDKEKAIHDYIVIHTAYDFRNYENGTLPGTTFNDYGVLINGSAVCEGYSKAMLKLMRMAGLQAKSVVGYGIDSTNNKIPHAWNMVEINGLFTMVDATWDDPVPDEKNMVYYNYFDVSDSDLAKDHLWDMSKYPRTSTIALNFQQ